MSKTTLNDGKSPNPISPIHPNLSVITHDESVVSGNPAPISTDHLVALDSQEATGAGPRLSTLRVVLLAGGITSINFLSAASTGSATLLIPSIARDLRISVLEAQFVSSAYTMAFACGLLFAGRLADVYGRRNLYMAGLVIYAVFAVVTGSVKNLISLSVTRLCSGLGLSIASPAGFGIIGVNVRHEPARTVVFAVMGLGVPIGGAFGNFIGGLMAGSGKGSWAYLFYLLSGLAVLLLIFAYFVIPADPDDTGERDLRIDWAGGALVTTAICLFTFSLTYSGIADKGWSSPLVYALLATSMILFAAWIMWSLHLEHHTSYPPIMKMSLFTRRHGLISYACASYFFVSICIFGWIYTSAIFYQSYKGMTPLGNAIATLPNTVTGTLSALTVVFLASRVRAPYLLGISSFMTVTCCVLYAVRPQGISFWAMEFPAQLLQSWGIVYVVGLGNILICNLVEQHEQSIGGALFQVSGTVAAALGICLSSLICSEVQARQGNVLAGVRAAYAFAAGCGFIVTLLAVIGFRKVGLAKDVGRME